MSSGAGSMQGYQKAASRTSRGLARSYYSADLARFRADGADGVAASLCARHPFDLSQNEKDAWLETIRILQEQLAGIDGHILLEYSIPRMDSRIDAVVLASGVVFVIEFKAGKRAYSAVDEDQVMDYALYVKYFHAQSRDTPVAPVLVATRAGDVHDEVAWDRGVAGVLRSNGTNLGEVIRRSARSKKAAPINAADWEEAGYSPTPTIIEAARLLYRGHTVRNLRYNDAGAASMRKTIGEVEKIIEESRRRGSKSICFVTGVPGAGKTLAGMEIVGGTKRDGASKAVFLSGNMYLVGVLQEALVRDSVTRKKAMARDAAGPRITKSHERVLVRSFVQNIHAFRNAHFEDSSVPPEHVVVFDEAQRTWTNKELARYMKKKRGVENVSVSEPEHLMGIMDRREEWASIVCLVGEGQEINRGEVGPGGWIRAVEKFPGWDVYVHETGGEWGGLSDISRAAGEGSVHTLPRLRLSVPLRSFRSEHVADFVDMLLKRDVEGAREMRKKLGAYQVFRTRRLDCAKDWLRCRARGTERYGIVASSQSLRLQPHGIYVKLAVDAVKWFLNGKGDPQSSYSMEYAATEFKAQGLEVDWACVAWDADLRFDGGSWSHKRFRSPQWVNINAKDDQRYRENAYRVILTRARQGMVIYVPKGDLEDPTRKPAYYDATYDYLGSVGIRELSAQPCDGA